MKKAGSGPVFFGVQLTMSINQAALGRQAESVSIITLLPVFRQLKKRVVIGFAFTAKPTVLYLKSATIKISESPSGELIIEIEPP